MLSHSPVFKGGRTSGVSGDPPMSHSSSNSRSSDHHSYNSSANNSISPHNHTHYRNNNNNNNNNSSDDNSERPKNPYPGASHGSSVMPMHQTSPASPPAPSSQLAKGDSATTQYAAAAAAAESTSFRGAAAMPHAPMCGDSNSNALAGDREGWRNTVEYRAAWDLEVWKAVQAERFRRQLEKHKVIALDELRRRMKAKEKQELAVLMERRKDLERREEIFKAEETKQRQQKSRLEEAEKELTRARHQLLEAQKRVEEEIRVQVRRANEDFEHKSLLLRDQVRMAEAQAKRLEERLARSEADYLVLFEEFHRFRTEHVTGSNGGGHYVDSGVESGNTTRYLLVEGLRSRHAEELRLLQDRLEQKANHEIQDWRRRCEELEKENTKLVSALARRREQLRLSSISINGNGYRMKKTTPSSILVTSSPQTLNDPSKTANNAPNISSKMIAIAVELDRLQRERCRLIEESGGALDKGDAVVDSLTARIAALRNEWDHAVSYQRPEDPLNLDDEK